MRLDDLKTRLNMTDGDMERAAQRLLDDRLSVGLLDELERDAIEAMLLEYDHVGLREGRDTVKTIRALVHALRFLAGRVGAQQPVKGVV